MNLNLNINLAYLFNFDINSGYLFYFDIQLILINTIILHIRSSNLSFCSESQDLNITWNAQ
jgi:hypothetical protein